MKIIDKLIVAAAVILIILHFYLPFIQDQNGLHSAYFGLKYANIHWGFYYFYAAIFSILICLITFIIFSQKKFREYYNYVALGWFYCMVVIGSFGVPLENFLQKNPDLHIKAYANLSSIFTISLFALPIIAVIQLIVGMDEQMRRDSKKNSNEKYESYLKNKKIIYQTTIYLRKNWRDIFSDIKPSKLALTSKEIIIAQKEGYMTIQYHSIKSIKKNWEGDLNAGINTPFKLILKDGTIYKIRWTTEGGIFGNYSKTKEIYEKIYKIMNGEKIKNEPKEKTRISQKDTIKYFIYSTLIYSAIVIAKDSKIFLMTLAGIGLFEGILYLRKNVELA